MDFIKERYELCVERIHEIAQVQEVPEKYQDYFKKEAQFILNVVEVARLVETGEYKRLSIETLKQWNETLYEKILPKDYETNDINPTVAVKHFGKQEGCFLSALSAKLMSLISDAMKQNWYFMTITMELFLEIYVRYEDYDEFALKDVKEAYKSHMLDNHREYMEKFLLETYSPETVFAKEIIFSNDANALYQYGDYITENEEKIAQFLNQMPQVDIEAMADTYVDGYIRGFEVMGVHRKEQGVALVSYPIGFERMMAVAIQKFEANGVRVVARQGARSKVNPQYEYDHRHDKALYLNKSYVTRELENTKVLFEEQKQMLSEYIGPAIVQTFGEPEFLPVNKKEVLHLNKRQVKLELDSGRSYSEVACKYIKSDETSYTIIAYPMPSISEQFEEIFAETVRCNTLSNETYIKIQQALIDELDTGYACKIVGTNGNETNLTVMLMETKEPEKETKFENCTADVNIPVGEVFTSPVLKGTNGLLHVSKIFIGKYEYKNLKIWFKDGKTEKLSCENFETEAENQNFLSENLLFHHEWLPLGEFAIGTNTTAFVMGEKYQIASKLPVLIAEKTGPHFAIGDTCYKRSEDHKVYNRDGKEIIARENECSKLRYTEPEKAYFNCHTDITIPYGEIGEISSLKKDGTKTILIKDGRFVLKGTEELNRPLEEYEQNKNK